MRVKQVIIPILLILILVIFNKVFLSAFSRANNYFLTQSLYSSEEVQPQKLFDRTWKNKRHQTICKKCRDRENHRLIRQTKKNSV